MSPVSAAVVVRGFHPHKVVPRPNLDQLGALMRRLLATLQTLERFVPGLSAQAVPTSEDVRRMCDEVCSGLNALLPVEKRTNAIEALAQTVQEIVLQLAATVEPSWHEGVPLRNLQARLTQLQRAMPTHDAQHTFVPPNRNKDGSVTWTPAKYDSCLLPPKMHHTAAPISALRRAYAALALTHETMVVTRPPEGLLHGDTLWAVGRGDRPALLEAFRFTVAGAAGQEPRAHGALTLERAYEQLDVTQAMRAIMEEPPPSHHKVWRLLLPRLGLFVRQHTPYRVLDAALCVQSRQLLYAMQRQTGNLKALHQTLPDHNPMRQALVWSLAAQGFMQLARMHDFGHYGHYNVGPESIVFNRHGELKMSRFEHAARRGERACMRPLFVGPIAAPEMVKHSRAPLQGIELTPKADVFALATLIAQVAAPEDGRPNPFVLPPEMDAAQAYPLLRNRFRLFARWQLGLVSKLGDTISCTAIAHDRSNFGRFFAPLAKLAPELCDLMFSAALTESCWRRADAMAIARRVLDLCSPPWRHAEGQSLLIDAMQAIDAGCDMPTFLAEAQAYRTWHEGIAQVQDVPSNDDSLEA